VAKITGVITKSTEATSLGSNEENDESAPSGISCKLRVSFLNHLLDGNSCKNLFDFHLSIFRFCNYDLFT